MNDAIAAFAALGQGTRLALFRRLMEQGPSGLPAGQLAEELRVPASTLSSHLAQLERAGLVRSWRRQRWIFYAVDINGTAGLVRFLTEDCCRGHPEICGFGPGRCEAAADHGAAGRHGTEGEPAASPVSENTPPERPQARRRG